VGVIPRDRPHVPTKNRATTLVEAVMNVTVATLGFPRIGPKRKLKAALESHWSGKTNADALLATAANLREAAWKRQRDLGADIIPSNDFSLYDHVLDTTAMVGARCRRHQSHSIRVRCLWHPRQLSGHAGCSSKSMVSRRPLLRPQSFDEHSFDRRSYHLKNNLRHHLLS
jgi:hypothetical protein